MVLLALENILMIVKHPIAKHPAAKHPIAKHIHDGFTLIELLVAIAIIAVLAVIAVPQYQTYTKKAKFAEVISATAPFKLGIDACVAEQGVNSQDSLVAQCGTSGMNGMPAAVNVSSGNVESVSVINAQITAVAVGSSASSVNGLNGETYLLVPRAGEQGASSLLTWTKEGTCVAAGLC